MLVSPHLLDSRVEPAFERATWSPLMMRAAEIETAFEGLEAGLQDADGRRELFVVHPQAVQAGRGIAPTTQLALGVLLPGELSNPRRDNSAGVAMCIGGTGSITVAGRELTVTKNDVWTKPSMALEQFTNNGDVPFRYLRYSNAALLQTLNDYYVDGGREGKLNGGLEPEEGARSKDLTPPIPLGADGAQLLSYEHLIDPDYVEDNPLVFKWDEVKPHLSGVADIKTGYTGRPLYLLYNPATGRLNGTTATFFATIASPGPTFGGGTHRHMSSAVNYHFEGSGKSVVEGEEVEWFAGDLMLSAPGWSAHQHTVGPEGAKILTIQDHPFHISNGSLVWQEDIENGEIITLGSQRGFQTNIQQFASKK